MTKIHPAEFDGNATTTSTTDNGDDAHVLSGADDGDASPNAISAMEKNEMPVENSNVSGSNGERFHEASPPNNDQVRYEMNDAFFDSSGVVHDGETFSYFDAMEVLYFDNMLYQQQSPLDRQSPQLLARELPFETQKVAAIDENEEEEQEQKSIAHKIKGRVDAKQKNLRKLARQQREALERSIHARRKKMKKMISDPGFVMTMDKISFVLGVVTIMTIELVLLLIPDQMGMLYTALLLPLMVARYIIYRADLYHYFMYDFCYFSQLLMLLQMYVYPNNIRFSKALFSIANGPLALAVVMWRNR